MGLGTMLRIEAATVTRKEGIYLAYVAKNVWFGARGKLEVIRTMSQRSIDFEPLYLFCCSSIDKAFSLHFHLSFYLLHVIQVTS